MNIRDLQAGNLALNIALQDGDTHRRAEGAVGLRLRAGANARRLRGRAGHDRPAGAVAGGGLTDRGSDSRIVIVRTVNGKKKEIKAKLTDIVEPGDTMIVQERFF